MHELKVKLLGSYPHHEMGLAINFASIGRQGGLEAGPGGRQQDHCLLDTEAKPSFLKCTYQQAHGADGSLEGVRIPEHPRGKSIVSKKRGCVRAEMRRVQG